MSLVAQLQQRAGDAPFLLEGTQVFSYHDVDEWSARIAGRLVEWGVQPGDRVVFAQRNSAAYVASVYGIQRAGAVAVLVNPRWTAHEVQGVVELCSPRVVVAPHELQSPTRSLDDLAAGGGSGIDPRPNPGDEAVMLLTSGTTGKPKAIVLTHASMVANAEQLNERKELVSADRFLCSLPLFHSHGQVAGLQSMMLAGASLTILDGFTPASFLQALEQTECTAISGVPTLYQRLLNHHRHNPVDFSRLRLLTSGGAPLTERMFHEIEEAFGAPVYKGYGLSESSSAASGNPIPHRIPGTIGIPLPRTQMQITRDDGTPAAPDEVGEVWVRGPQLMKGYYNDTAATAEAITPDGWLRTGDLGTCRPDGYFTIAGRKKEMIIRSGFNVFPAEVENALRGVEGVVDMAVVGLPHDVYGEAVHAALVCEPQADHQVIEQAISNLGTERLAGYKRPLSLSFHDELPRTGSTKVQRRALVEALKHQPNRIHRME